ncbi:MAG: hypothetical protein KDB47_12245, partial [Mycobacterium sp.]|nr:hypothetical protein [Mycobacterium sp.]
RVITTAYLCPVCHREVKPTVGRNITRHMDSLRRDICPGGGEPLSSAVTIDLSQGNMGVA